MKKIICLLFLFFNIMFIGISYVKAASGSVYVYYQNEQNANRGLTYTYTKKHMSSIGYTVYQRSNQDSSKLLNTLKDAKIFVVHFHGSPGKQDTGEINGNYFGLAGKSGDGNYYKSISSLKKNSLKNLKIGIFYGCSTGEVSPTYGNLPLNIVNKGAQAAVAWTVTTYPNEVNEWNRLFFEKAIDDTIVESFRHADYWIEYTLGSVTKKRMQNHRNEAGNIYGYVY